MTRLAEVFVTAPFDGETDPVFEAIIWATQQVGLKVARPDQMPAGALATSLALDRIRQADLIIADVSRPSSRVMYELGFADALRKPIILLLNIKSGHSLPSELVGFQYVTYDPADLSKLTMRIKSEIEAVMMQRSA